MLKLNIKLLVDPPPQKKMTVAHLSVLNDRPTFRKAQGHIHCLQTTQAQAKRILLAYMYNVYAKSMRFACGFCFINYVVNLAV